MAGGCTTASPNTVPASTTTSQATSAEAAPVALVIHAVGDSLVHPDLLDVQPGYGDLLQEMSESFTSDDLTIMNLECAASTRGTPAADRPFALRCDADGFAALHAAGVDVVSVANDASTDFGDIALADTVEALLLADITVVGADSQPATMTLGNRSVAVFGFSVLGDMAVATAVMLDQVETATASHDLVLVTIHWGEPEDRDPNPDQIGLAEALAEAGADAIYGHGSHRLQSLRSEFGVPVAYGLGHFLWPLNNERDPDTAVAYTEVDVNGAVATCLLPATIRTSGRPALDRPDAGCDIGSAAARATVDE